MPAPVVAMADAASGRPGAPSAGSAAMRADIDQPTIFLDHMSITTARQGHPWCVRT